MNVQRSRDDREVQLVTEALRGPLPPARLTADPSALWACGRHARRISTEARISLVVMAAEVSALVGVLGVLIAFVDWRAAWTASTDVLRTDPYAAVYAVMTLAAIAAASLLRRSSSDVKT